MMRFFKNKLLHVQYSFMHKIDVTVITQTIFTTPELQCKHFTNEIQNCYCSRQHSKVGDKTRICHTLLSDPKMELVEPVLSLQRNLL